MPLYGTNNGVANDIHPHPEGPQHRFAASLDIPLSKSQAKDFFGFAKQSLFSKINISSRSALAQIGVDVRMAGNPSIDSLKERYKENVTKGKRELSLPVEILLESSFARKYYRHELASILEGREIGRAFVVHPEEALKLKEIHKLYNFPKGSVEIGDDAIAVPMVDDIYYEMNVENLTDGAAALRAVVRGGRNALKRVLRLQQGTPKLKRTLVTAFGIESKVPNEMPPTHVVLDTATTMKNADHFQAIWLDKGRTDDQHRTVNQKHNGKNKQYFQLEFKNLRTEAFDPRDVPRILTVLRFYREACFELMQYDEEEEDELSFANAV